MAELVLFPSASVSTSMPPLVRSISAPTQGVSIGKVMPPLVRSNSVATQGVQVDVQLRLPVHKLWEALKNISYVAPMVPLSLNHKLLRGNGGVGSISLIQFADAQYEETERVEAIDEHNHTLISTVIAHDTLHGHNDHEYTKTVFLTPSRDGSATITRWRAEYSPGADGALAKTSTASGNALKLFEALELHYLATCPESSPDVVTVS